MPYVSRVDPKAEVRACRGTDSWPVFPVNGAVAQCAYQGSHASCRGEAQADAVLVAHYDSVVCPAVAEGSEQADIPDVCEIYRALTGPGSRGDVGHGATDHPDFLALLQKREAPRRTAHEGAGHGCLDRKVVRQRQQQDNEGRQEKQRCHAARTPCTRSGLGRCYSSRVHAEQRRGSVVGCAQSLAPRSSCKTCRQQARPGALWSVSGPDANGRRPGRGTCG